VVAGGRWPVVVGGGRWWSVVVGGGRWFGFAHHDGSCVSASLDAIAQRGGSARLRSPLNNTARIASRHQNDLVVIQKKNFLKTTFNPVGDNLPTEDSQPS